MILTRTASRFARLIALPCCLACALLAHGSARAADTRAVAEAKPGAPALRISDRIAVLPAYANGADSEKRLAGPRVASDATPGAARALPDTIWNRIRSGLALRNAEQPQVAAHEAWFRKNPAYLRKAAERSRPYLFHIVEAVEQRDMPLEIALLPFIESAFDPMAQSPMQASGIWQFIPATGRVFGLSQNNWYDGRRDVVEATQAALDYLEKLHDMFGDWELALAAYNCGEGCVARALSRGAGKSYWGLGLPAETRQYVPRLLAVRNIVLNPEAYGLQLPDIANTPYFMPLALKRPIEAKTAARLADMPLDAFIALNPGFKRRVLHTETRARLLLPVDRFETFQFNLHRAGLERSTLQTYAAKKGESVARIAAKFRVTEAWLREHNPLKLARGRITQAQTLVVPYLASAPAPEKSPRASAPVRHTVRKGDTLIKLAQLYKVEASDIERLNRIEGALKPGMELEIPS